MNFRLIKMASSSLTEDHTFLLDLFEVEGMREEVVTFSK